MTRVDVLESDKLRKSRSVLYRAWQLKEALRDAHRLREFGAAHQFLDRWLAWACRSRIPSFVRLSKTIREHRDGSLPMWSSGSRTPNSRD
jgi:transposase